MSDRRVGARGDRLKSDCGLHRERKIERKREEKRRGEEKKRNTFSHFPREYCVRYPAGPDNLTAASLVTLSECRNNLGRACHRRRVALVSARRGRIRFHRVAVVAFPHRQISGWSAPTPSRYPVAATVAARSFPHEPHEFCHRLLRVRTRRPAIRIKLVRR